LATKRKASLLGGLSFFGKLLDSNPLKGSPQISNLWGE